MEWMVREIPHYLTVALLSACRSALVWLPVVVVSSTLPTLSTIGIQFRISPRAIKNMVFSWKVKVSPGGRLSMITNRPLACVNKRQKSNKIRNHITNQLKSLTQQHIFY